jgi:hypothetical protein
VLSFLIAAVGCIATIFELHRFINFTRECLLNITISALSLAYSCASWFDAQDRQEEAGEEELSEIKTQ